MKDMEELKMAEKERKKTKTEPKKIDKISLEAGPPLETPKGFKIRFKITTTDGKTREPKECEVALSCNLRRIETLTTDKAKAGKVVCVHRFPINMANKTTKITAEIVNSPSSSDSVEIEFPQPTFNYGKGRKKFIIGIVQACKFKKKSIKIAAVKATIALIFAYAVVAFTGGGKLNMILGIMFGGLLCKILIAKGKKPLTIAGIIIGIAIPILCFFDSYLIVGGLYRAFFLVYFFGGMAYLAEDLLPRKPDGKEWNVYPWMPIVLGLIAAMVCFLSIFGHFMPGNDINIISFSKEAATIDLSQHIPSLEEVRVIDLNKPTAFPGKNLSGKFAKAGNNLRNMFIFISATIFLLAYALPNEIINIFKGKGFTAETTGGHVIINQIVEGFKAMFFWKKGKR